MYVTLETIYLQTKRYSGKYQHRNKRIVSVLFDEKCWQRLAVTAVLNAKTMLTRGETAQTNGPVVSMAVFNQCGNQKTHTDKNREQ